MQGGPAFLLGRAMLAVLSEPGAGFIAGILVRFSLRRLRERKTRAGSSDLIR